MEKKKNNMALASMILGIISIVTVCCCYGGIIFGSLAILLALLSKTEDEMESNAKTGLITGCIGLGLSVFAFGGLIMWNLASGAFHDAGIMHHVGGIHV